MKITLDAIDGQQFTLRLPRAADGREHVVALHTTRRLRGAYAQDPATIRLDPVEADEIVGEVAWLLAGGALRLAGPARLGATSLDLEVALDDRRPGVKGLARCASLAVPGLEVTVGELDVRGAVTAGELRATHDAPTDTWAIATPTIGAAALVVARTGLRAEAGRLAARGVEASLGAVATVSIDELDVAELALTIGEARVSIASAALLGLGVSRRDGALAVEASAVTLRGVEVVVGDRRARIDEARIARPRYSPVEISLERAEADELVIEAGGLDAGGDRESRPDAAPVDGAPRQLGLDLFFLDLLDGRIAAETRVDVKLPVIKHRVATHSADLAVTAGSIDFKELEHGLSLVEDAILDFEVEDAALVLELDALLAKKTLLRWPLDEAGVERARRGAVRLRTLLQPTTEAPPARDDDDGDGPPSVALLRVDVEGLRVDVGVRGGSTEPLATGALRLGGGGSPALESLSVRGALAHDAAHDGDPTVLRVEAAGLDVGLEGVALGGRRVDLAGLALAALADGAVTFRGFTPTGASATLRGLSLRALRVGPPPASP